MIERFAGRYLLLRRLGQGGMGDVFLARDLTTRSECALKRFTAKGQAREILLREFELMARVHHPSVVEVGELGIAPEGTPYLTMEYVPGIRADRAVVRGDWRTLLFVATQVTQGLEALHAADVIHGDLKPSNLLVVPGAPEQLPSSVRIVDFGLAAILGGNGAGHRGTPGYAAPEVVRGQEPSIASDLYGLGATLYELISSHGPFEGEDASALLRRQQSGPPPSLPLEEAGAAPALVQLVLRLMAADPRERPRDAREVRRELWRIDPLVRRPIAERLDTAVVVGREEELARLEQWATSEQARTRLFLVSGAAGSGKSALLGEVATRSTLAGRAHALLSCAAFPGSGAVARVLLRRLAAAARGEPRPETLSPSAHALFDDPEAPLLERDLGELADAAALWAIAAGRRDGTWLVLLDDAEHLDALTRAWIRRLVMHVSSPPLRWVWARRDSEPQEAWDDEPLLLEGGLAEKAELGPLDREGVARIASTRLGEPAPLALLDFLWNRGGGHPGLTVELLRAAAVAGALTERDSGLGIDADRLSGIGVSADFEVSLLSRFAELEEGARRAAGALAVWGQPLDLERVQRLRPGIDAQALGQLVASGLATRTEDGTWTLRPPALGTRLLGSLDEGERRALHRAALREPALSHAERFHHLREAGEIAAALRAAETAFQDAPDERLAGLAAGLAEPVMPALAATWHDRAARQLADRGRYAAAAPHLERALALDPDPEVRPERWVRLSSASLQAGLLDRVADVVAQALREDPPPPSRAKLLTNEAARLHAIGRHDSAAEAAGRALTLAEQAGDPEALGAATRFLAYHALSRGRLDQAEAMALRSEEACNTGADVLGQIRATGVRAAIARAQRRLGEAERLYREALERARVLDRRLAREEILLNLAVVLTEAGQWSSLREVFEEAARIAFEDARSSGAAGATASLAIADGLNGRARPALRHARAAVRLTRRYKPRLEPYAWRALAQAHRIAGRLRRAEHAARRALALALRHAPEEVDWCRVELGRVWAEAARWGESGELWERALESASADPLVVAVLEGWTGRAALRRGDAESAMARLRSLEKRMEKWAAPYPQAIAHQLRAELALEQGKLAEATEVVEETLRRFAALPAPADRALAALDFARMAPGTKEIQKAVIGWLDTADDGFARLGDHFHRERALTLLVEWQRRDSAHEPLAIAGRGLIEQVSWLLNSLTDFHELTQRAMRMAVEQLDAERGVLLMTDPESGQLLPMAEYGAVDADTRREAIGYSRRVVQKVTESGDSLLITDAPADPRAVSESVMDMRLRSILCVPMFLGGQVIGAVYLDDSTRTHTFGDADRGMLEGFAHLMAVAIEKSRGHEEIERAKELLEGENLSLRQEVGSRFRTHNVIGTSAPIKRVLAIVEHAYRINTTVLITGENGTGKELIARTLHHGGKRRMKPFVAVNCGAIPESLLESELFGILPNVATGVRGRPGMFVRANGGTLFLDEIGEMPLKQQVALLAAIANREITPVGGGRTISVDVRIIVATNHDLRKRVQEGAFREDLYFRLNVIEIEVPPLRDRKADIPSLAKHFVQHFARQQEREVPELAPEFMAALMQSDWPGNVRELQNYIERVLAMTPGRVLHPDPLPRDLQERGVAVKLARGRKLIDSVGELERRLVHEALARAHGNQSHAARELGLTEQSIRYRIRKYGLAPARANRRSR